jgi:hypothetical protein
VSGWLLFNANSAIFQLYHGENKWIFNEMMMSSALYKTNTLSWIFIGLAHWNNSLRVDMSLHLDTLFWFRANQSALFPYHGENKLIFNEMMMSSALYKTNTLSWLFIGLAHWNNSLRVDMSLHFGHIILIPSQPVCSFSLSWREQVNFQWDDDEFRFVQDQHAELDFHSASSLKQQSAGRHVAPLGHIILIPSQSVFALFS